jgi:ankyrin repeat protein
MNINYKDEKGYTFLNCAVKSDCKKEIIQFLLNKGCNPNIGNVRLFFNFRIKEIVLCILQCLIKIIQLLIY